MSDLVGITIGIYPRPVRERDYGKGCEEFKEVVSRFAESVADGMHYTLRVWKSKNLDRSYLEIVMGRYSTEIEIVMPKEKVGQHLMDFVEPIKRIMNWEDDADVLDASAILMRLMYDVLLIDENYVDAEVKIEHDEAEGMTVIVKMHESYG